MQLVHRRAGGFAAFLVPVLALALASAPGQAQAPNRPAPANTAPPVPGFVPPYEVMRTVRAAGFDPLTLPLREGTIYVVRATDFRGILMRVVIDARTGAIRDANRILPAAGSYSGADGPYGRVSMVPPPYEPSVDLPAYGQPPHAEMPPPPVATGSVPLMPPAASATAPPLPRPRPALAAAKPADIGATPAPVDPRPDPKPAADAPPVPPATPAAPSAAASAAAAPPAAAKPKPPATLMINN